MFSGPDPWAMLMGASCFAGFFSIIVLAVWESYATLRRRRTRFTTKLREVEARARKNPPSPAVERSPLPRRKSRFASLALALLIVALLICAIPAVVYGDVEDAIPFLFILAIGILWRIRVYWQDRSARRNGVLQRAEAPKEISLEDMPSTPKEFAPE